MNALDDLEQKVIDKFTLRAAARTPALFSDAPFDVSEWFGDIDPLPVDTPQFSREQWVTLPNKRRVALTIVDRVLELETLTEELWYQVSFLMLYGGRERIA